MRNWALSLLAFLILAAPVAATPPQVIWVRDTLFAQGADRVMILRSIMDNHGSHYTTQTDTFLLILSLSDGAVINVAPVERVVDIHLGEPDLDSTTFTPLEDAVNPFAARAQAGFAPLTAPTHGYGPNAMILPTGIILTDGDTLTHQLDMRAAQKQMQHALTATRALLPVLHSDGGDADPFDPSAYSILRDCKVQAALTFWQLDGPIPAIVNLSCDDMEDAGSLDVWIVLPEITPH